LPTSGGGACEPRFFSWEKLGNATEYKALGLASLVYNNVLLPKIRSIKLLDYKHALSRKYGKS
jgi:hypothetical protein